MNLRNLVVIFILSSIVALWGADWDELGRLTPEEKIYGLSVIWKEAEYNYPHFQQLPNLNWDREYRSYLSRVLETGNIYEYYQTLQQFAALLQDCHTRVILPQTFSTRLDYPLIQLKRIEGRVIVANIGNINAGGLPIGSEILQVNDLSLERYLREEVHPYISASNEAVLNNKGLSLLFFGERDNEVKVTFRYPPEYQEEPDKSGTIGEAMLVRNRMFDRWSAPMDTKEELLLHRWLDDEILYVALYSFNDELLIRLWHSIIPELQRSKGLILDLRENRWGKLEVSNEILKYLTTKEVLRGVTTESRQNISLYKAWGTPIQLYSYLPPEEYAAYGRGDVWHQEEPYEIGNDLEREKITVPLVVLIGSETASAAEDFLVMLREARHDVRLVGSHSAGSRGQAIILRLPGDGHIFIATQRDRYGEGNILTRKGVQVDLEAELKYEEYLAGEDNVIEAGAEVLREMIRKR